MGALKHLSQSETVNTNLDIDVYGHRPGFFSLEDFESESEYEDYVPYQSTSVLLVEDDYVTSDSIKRKIMKILANQVQVRSFASAEKAEEYILTLKKYGLPGPEVAIVDYMLSGNKDGLWVCNLLDKYFPETQSVLISGLPEESIKVEMENRRTKPYYMKKPLDLNYMQNLITHNISKDGSYV